MQQVVYPWIVVYTVYTHFFISLTIFGNRVNLWKKEKGGNNEFFAIFIAVLGMKLNKLSLTLLEVRVLLIKNRENRVNR